VSYFAVVVNRCWIQDQLDDGLGEIGERYSAATIPDSRKPSFTSHNCVALRTAATMVVSLRIFILVMSCGAGGRDRYPCNRYLGGV